ncbi:hypothetical protein [Sphingomonas yabuuchiae]|uniref:Uncharacterized protein n=1 Tax=Sphingomonas yabuuchiae TaxID=172044 RepID=A0AA41DCG1_9SPHN|nr:hypothetical protein [Sphingomonas yabuuchiae]MBB4611724.1 hypothetical protein [Sphingomonas yabuuchiae]MBN3558119.1 hypothetical protein [Sphingomonas yabuuchiae]
MSRYGFTKRTTLGIIHHVDNLTQVAGHKRLFGKTGGYGWSFYRYNQPTPSFALHRVWNFVFFAVHHVGTGDSVDPPGWHVTRARLWIERERGGIALRWRKANTFRVRAAA